MNSQSKPEPGGEQPPKVQPDISFWDIKEVKNKKVVSFAKSFFSNQILPLSVTGAMLLILHKSLSAESLDSGHKTAITIVIVFGFVILGMAHILRGVNQHAETSKNDPIKSFDA